jgi:Deacetylase PdaC
MEARLKHLLIVAAIGIAGCDAPAPTAAPEGKADEAAAPAPTPAVVPASDLLIRERSDDLEFGWRMVPDVAAYPALLAELRRDAAARLTEARKGAAEDRAARPADAPFFGHSFQQNWRVEADTPRLLSLVGQTDTFTGGAHGMHVTQGVIWDKTAAKRLTLPDLFTDWAAARGLIEPVYCRELDEARAKRRGAAKTGGLFDGCPPLLEQTVTLAGWSENSAGGMKVYLDPYTAGPYAEGTYELWVFPEPAITPLLKPEYRPKS